VIIKDAAGNPVANQSVTFTVGSGGGSVTGGAAVTSSAGIASVGSWQLGPSAGTNTLVATSGTLPAVTFTATGTAATGGGSFTGNFLAWTDFSDVQHLNKLVRVNGQTGAVTNIGGSNFLSALAYGPDGTLYGTSMDLVAINPTSGSTTLVGSFIFQGKRILMAAATFSPSGTLFVRENDDPHRVFTVNLSNAALTLIGTPQDNLAGMAFDATGTLYATTVSTLLTLSPTTLATTTVIGRTPTFISELAFGASGNLYGIDIFPSSRLFTLNVTSASATSTILVGCGCLVSLVAERSSPSAVTGFNRVRATHPGAPTLSLHELQQLAGALKAQRRRAVAP
jgi:hypothetical protein